MFNRRAWGGEFLKKLKWFMVWYGCIYIVIALFTFHITNPPVPLGIYLLMLASLAATIALAFMPIRLFEKVIPLSIPAYLVFIHILLSYSNDINAYIVLYLMPIILASVLFGYAWTIITGLFTLFSHMLLDASYYNKLPFYAELYHFIINDISFISLIVLTAVMGTYLAHMLEEDKNQIENTKLELEATFDAISDMITIHDTDHRIVRANKTAAERLKKDYGDIIGKKCHEVYHGADAPIPDCPHSRTLKTGMPSMCTIEESRLEGIFEATTYPLYDTNSVLQGSVHYMKDITLHKKTQDALNMEMDVLKILHDVDKAILSSLNRNDVLRLCITNLKTLVNTEYISIALLDAEKDEFKIEANLFLDCLGKNEEPIPYDSTILKSVIFSRAYRYCPEMLEQDLFPHDRELRDKGLKSILLVPLIAKGEPLGVLVMGSHQKERFKEKDIELVNKYALQIAIAIDNSNLYENLQSLFMNTVMSLATAIDAKSPWTQNHSWRVTDYAILIARELGLDEQAVQELRLAVLLHDIGKIGIDDSILNKPSKLSDEETAAMRQHPLKGSIILEPIKEFKKIIPIVRHHHEWWDGRGYPEGLSGNMIPLEARILNAADAYEAMTTNRPYRRKLSGTEANEELARFSGKQFDPVVVDAFMRVLNRMQGNA